MITATHLQDPKACMSILVNDNNNRTRRFHRLPVVQAARAAHFSSACNGLVFGEHVLTVTMGRKAATVHVQPDAGGFASGGLVWSERSLHGTSKQNAGTAAPYHVQIWATATTAAALVALRRVLDLPLHFGEQVPHTC